MWSYLHAGDTIVHVHVWECVETPEWPLSSLGMVEKHVPNKNWGESHIRGVGKNFSRGGRFKCLFLKGLFLH